MVMDFAQVTVIIPTLNEEKNIDTLIQKLAGLYPGIHIIVSDDGSSDNTQEKVLLFAQKNLSIQLLDRSKEPIHGLSASVVDGIKNEINSITNIGNCICFICF